MASESTYRTFFRVTAKNLASLLGALPKSIRNTVKRAAAKDWREDASAKADIKERRAELEGGLPMGYALVYESKDGKLCLYQDREGHLVAADARKMV